jgi:hypothetical protein
MGVNLGERKLRTMLISARSVAHRGVAQYKDLAVVSGNLLRHHYVFYSNLPVDAQYSVVIFIGKRT